MRKYLRNITVGAALLLLAGSCTDKFEEYNTNQYQIHDADPATLMKSMIETIVNIQQNDSQMQDQMVGQVAIYAVLTHGVVQTSAHSIRVMPGMLPPGTLRLKKYMETFSKYKKRQILRDIIMLLRV